MTKEELLRLMDGLDDDDEVDIPRLLRERAEAHEALVEEIEERQHQSGFYAFQDRLEMYRRER